MFGTLARKYLRRRRGRYPTYRSRGLKRYARGPMYRSRGRRSVGRGLAGQNRVVTMIHRLEQYNGGESEFGINIVSGPVDVHYHQTVALSSFPGTGPFAALYHQFRIVKVIYEFFPVNQQGRYNEGTETDLSKMYTPTLYTAINRTATSFADTITKMASTNNMRSVLAGRYHKRVFVPCTLGQTYQSSIETAYNPEYKEWLSVEDTSTPHFGLDVLLSSTGSPGGSFKYKMRTTIIAQYKNRKANIDLS
ncbi:MAG: capsid jelly roll protein [Circoviridae sp.]|nr:MAG: capsid jelly roll protein [Circoviridae sp.]